MYAAVEEGHFAIVTALIQKDIENEKALAVRK